MNIHEDTRPASKAYDRGKQSRLGALLCLLAGTDRHVLASCPASDRLAYATFGMLLLTGFIWILLTTSLGLSTMFGGDSLSNFACALVGALIGVVVVAVDRLIIIADAITEGELALDLGIAHPMWMRLKRAALVVARIALAWFVASVSAETFSLWLDDEAVEQQLIRDHYAENAAVYDAIDAHTQLIDGEIASYKQALDQSAAQIVRLQETIKGLQDSEASVPADAELSQLNNKLNALRQTEARLLSDVALYEDTMECERLGERCRDGDSGRDGFGRRWELAKSRRDRAAADLNDVRSEIDEVAARIAAGAAELTSLREAAERRLANQIASARDELADARRLHGEATEKYSTAVEARAGGIATFTEFQIAQPGFVPLKMGVSERREALRTVHEASPAAAAFTQSIKFAIITIELMAIIMKLIMPPKTEYAMRLAAAYHLRRLELRAEFNEASAAVQRRQRRHTSEQRAEERTRRAREAADRSWRTVEEQVDEELDELLRKSSARNNGEHHEPTET